MQRLLTVLIVVLGTVVASVAQNPPSSILGKTDIHALLEAVPGVPGSTSDAATRAYGADLRGAQRQWNLEILYRPFFDRVATERSRLNDRINSRKKYMPDQATVQKQAMDMSNASPVIAGAGGVENIQRMSPEQARQALQQSATAFGQKAVTRAGGNSAGMQVLMQKVMNDPAYRERFQQMSEEEKQAEVRKYTGVAPTPRPNHVERPSQVPPHNDLAIAMAVREDLHKMLAKSIEIDNDFRKRDQAITDTKGTHKEIELETSAKIDKVPMVVLGEAGHVHDPGKVEVLNDQRFARHHDRASWELDQRAALYIQRKLRYKELATEYQSWLKQNLSRINTSLATPLRPVNTELETAGLEDLFINAAEDLARYSKKTTADAALYEKLYQERLAHRGPR